MSDQLTLEVDIDYDADKAPVRSKKKKPIKKVVIGNDLMMLLFPEDYPEEYKQWLLDCEYVNWSASELALIQVKMVKDAFDILRRSNSSLSSIDECLIWCFIEKEDYDFSIEKCARTIGVRNEVLQSKFVDGLCATLRELKIKNRTRDKKRIEFISRCITRARIYMNHMNVRLTQTEYLAEYS